MGSKCKCVKTIKILVTALHIERQWVILSTLSWLVHFVLMWIHWGVCASNKYYHNN